MLAVIVSENVGWIIYCMY